MTLIWKLVILKSGKGRPQKSLKVVLSHPRRIGDHVIEFQTMYSKKEHVKGKVLNLTPIPVSVISRTKIWYQCTQWHINLYCLVPIKKTIRKTLTSTRLYDPKLVRFHTDKYWLVQGYQPVFEILLEEMTIICMWQI